MAPRGYVIWAGHLDEVRTWGCACGQVNDYAAPECVTCGTPRTEVPDLPVLSDAEFDLWLIEEG